MSPPPEWAEAAAVVLVVAAAWLWTAPTAPPRPRGGRTVGAGHRWRRNRTRRGIARPGGTGVPLGALLVEAAARMRSGAHAHTARRATLPDETGPPAHPHEPAAHAAP